MNEIDKFLNFLFKRIDDDRIKLHKEMKYGYRHYYLNIVLEKDKDPNSTFSHYNELSITIDNRNNCVNIYNSYIDNNQITIEDTELVKKWSDIFEEYLSNNLESSIKSLIHETMSGVKDKDLYREYQMEKIFKDDESI